MSIPFDFESTKKRLIDSFKVVTTIKKSESQASITIFFSPLIIKLSPESNAVVSIEYGSKYDFSSSAKLIRVFPFIRSGKDLDLRISLSDSLIAVADNKIEDIKTKITEKQRIKDTLLTKYSEMDKGDQLNKIWFNSSGVSPEGDEFIQLMKGYKSHVFNVFSSKYPVYIEMVENRFTTGDPLEGK